LRNLLLEQNDKLEWEFTIFVLFVKTLKCKLNKNSLDLAPIVSCAQCPICKTYVPIPPALLASLPNALPGPIRVENPVPIPQPFPSYIQPTNPIPVGPLVSRLNLNIVQ
jgi:hypothetical protein